MNVWRTEKEIEEREVGFIVSGRTERLIEEKEGCVRERAVR